MAAASDTFETGTVAAAWGGITTIVDFAVQTTGASVIDGLATWHEKADGNCAIDYGFHQIIGGVDDGQEIYGIVFVVVLFSVLVQGSLVPVVAERLGVPMERQSES